jgi:hypothetical protein
MQAIILTLLPIVIILGMLWLVIYALIDALKIPDRSQRIIWVAIILFFNIIGSIIYFIVQPGHRPPRP